MNIRDKSFIIIVFFNNQKIRLTCFQQGIGIGSDTWEIRARNKTLVLTNNRPLLEKAGLGHFPWTWTLIRGELQNRLLLQDITQILEKRIRSEGRPPLYPV